MDTKNILPNKFLDVHQKGHELVTCQNCLQEIKHLPLMSEWFVR